LREDTAHFWPPATGTSTGEYTLSIQSTKNVAHSSIDTEVTRESGRRRTRRF